MHSALGARYQVLDMESSQMGGLGSTEVCHLGEKIAQVTVQLQNDGTE